MRENNEPENPSAPGITVSSSDRVIIACTAKTAALFSFKKLSGCLKILSSLKLFSCLLNKSSTFLQPAKASSHHERRFQATVDFVVSTTEEICLKLSNWTINKT